jgi:hypothetical protein
MPATPTNTRFSRQTWCGFSRRRVAKLGGAALGPRLFVLLRFAQFDDLP